MSLYERRRWDELDAHWSKERRKLLPARASEALDTAGQNTHRVVTRAGQKLSRATPQGVKDAGGVVIDLSLAPTVAAIARLLELTTDMVAELMDPAPVLEYHRNRGRDVQTLADLRSLDLKELDEFTRRMSLRWRAIGAAEGGAFGGLAMLPGPGTAASLTLDTIVGHVLCSAIATRVAYSYGFDPTDPDQKHLIARMVSRAYKEQLPKSGTMLKSAQAFKAGKGRQRWSQKLREDQRLLAAVEKLMNQFSGTKATPVGKVVSKMPLISVVTGAGLNAHMLGDVASKATKFAATQFLAQKYELPLPAKLQRIVTDSDHESNPVADDDTEGGVSPA
jgi:hypothetical protein